MSNVKKVTATERSRELRIYQSAAETSEYNDQTQMETFLMMVLRLKINNLTSNHCRVPQIHPLLFSKTKKVPPLQFQEMLKEQELKSAAVF